MKLNDAKIVNYRGILCPDDGKPQNIRIKIPHYQRPYKWEEDEIKKLFKDYQRNKENNQELDYFIGALVTTKKHGESVHEMVDGQQRITTIYILCVLRFLLLRVYASEIIDIKRTSDFKTVFGSLLESYEAYVGYDKVDGLRNLQRKMENAIEEVEDDREKEAVILENFASAYKEFFCINENYSDDEEYALNEKYGLHSFFKKENLTLCYSRQHYAEELLKSICSICIKFSHKTNPVLIPCVEEKGIKETYINAFYTAFEKTKEYAEVGLNEQKKKNTPLNLCKEMISYLSEMIESLRLCIITTESEQDAYTLFEVLNDRAKAIEDIDLIKNMFFRRYCELSEDTEEQKDDNIQALDDYWGEIFPYDKEEKKNDTRSKYIQYFAAVYLTGDTSKSFNQNPKYRKELEGNYLATYNKDKRYELINIKNDFTVYHFSKIVIEKAELKFNNTYGDVLEAENDPKKSVVFKTIKVLHGLGLVSVLVALTNLIIAYYVSDKGSIEWDKDDFSRYIDELFDVKANKDEYLVIQQTAYNLRRICLLANNEVIPRDIAKQIIEKNCALNGYVGNPIILSAKQEEGLEEEFKNWTSDWMFSSTKAKTLKIKLLFLNLARMQFQDNKLVDGKTFTYIKDCYRIQLDHLEAQRKSDNEVLLQFYFEPAEETDDRRNYVDGLGNMMILDPEDNNYKNNEPMDMGLRHYDRFNSNCWLVEEIKNMLHCKDYAVQHANGKWTPKEKFFIERRARIQKYFLSLLIGEYGQNEYPIKDSEN